MENYNVSAYRMIQRKSTTLQRHSNSKRRLRVENRNGLAGQEHEKPTVMLIAKGRERQRNGAAIAIGRFQMFLISKLRGAGQQVSERRLRFMNKSPASSSSGY